MLDTPILFLIFNRPDTTSRVFDEIRKAKPKRLYVAADGPRANKEGESARVEKVREIATNVDWPCEVKTLFRKENFGCKIAVSSAITWFFEHEEEGIILEDDCVPHPDFFTFCASLLDYHRNNEQVFMISGNNFQNGRWRGDASYYFSKYAHIWGWATWRRAWKQYDRDLTFWSEWKTTEDYRAKLPSASERKYWEGIFDQVKTNKIDTWDYQLVASIWYNGGLTATPNVNLVSNIGFGEDATHTKDDQSIFYNKAVERIGNILHPSLIKRNKSADKYQFNKIINNRYNIYNKIKDIVNNIYNI